MFKLVLTLAIPLFLVYVFVWRPERTDKADLSLQFDFIEKVPAGTQIYRSAQLTYEQLDTLLASGKITYVLRLNGDYKDAGAMTTAEERALCDKHGVIFARINAHAGYVKDEGYRQTVQLTNEYLEAGHVLVHCKHGFHRAGAVIGAFLTAHGFDPEEVIEHNDWEVLAADPGDYYRYLETAFH